MLVIVQKSVNITLKGRIQMYFHKRYLSLFLFVLVLAVLASLTLFTPTEASEPAAPLAAYDCGYIVGRIRMCTA